MKSLTSTSLVISARCRGRNESPSRAHSFRRGPIGIAPVPVLARDQCLKRVLAPTLISADGFLSTRSLFGRPRRLRRDASYPVPARSGPPRDRDEALAVLRRAVELGVNHVDTAQFYGPNVSNELIREALHPYPANLALVSKVGGRRDDAGGWLPLELADYRKDIEANLRTLGVDQLAAVNLRLFESGAPDELFDDQLSVMIAARDDGLIGGIGLSEITREHLLHALERTEIVCVQNAFNLMHRASAPVLDECAARGIAVRARFSSWERRLPDPRSGAGATSWCRAPLNGSAARRRRSPWRGH